MGDVQGQDLLCSCPQALEFLPSGGLDGAFTLAFRRQIDEGTTFYEGISKLTLPT